MAGGIGSRFWPMSRTSFPKQFHDVLGTGRSLIQQTFDRYLTICPKENILVVTNASYKKLVQEQLPDILEDNILLEPVMRNTAPCIAYANFKIQSLNPEANIIVAPSDHLILKEQEFHEIINIALERASTSDSILTLGIKPSRPDTGYGYIQFDEESNFDIDPRLKTVSRFTEKPDLDNAKAFIESGDYYWNSGMFIWSLKNIQQLFQKNLPDMFGIFNDGAAKFGTPAEQDFIDEVFPICENISIDYGIMEKADKVELMLSDFGWSDLGTWGSLYSHIPKDENQNAIISGEIRTYDSSNNIIKLPEGKMACVQGLDDYIVAEFNDVLLICKKEEEQHIKTMVNELKAEGKTNRV
ncbi:MAG: mannose-1-phosphate guanylyltransferase [Gammaproteobacteria bacterium]|jgi:mannose-1-phosphate guanylyltransferase